MNFFEKSERLKIFELNKKKMFDSSSSSSSAEASRKVSPKIVFPQVNYSPSIEKKENYLLNFVSSKYYLIFTCIITSIPIIIYQHESPSLYCTNGLYYFCKPCPKNSHCSITTFSCFSNSTQYYSQCINGHYDKAFLDKAYNSYENGKFLDEWEEEERSKFSYDDFSLLLQSKEEYFIDNDGFIHPVKFTPFINYLSLAITNFLLCLSIRYGITAYFS